MDDLNATDKALYYCIRGNKIFLSLVHFLLCYFVMFWFIVFCLIFYVETLLYWTEYWIFSFYCGLENQKLIKKLLELTKPETSETFTTKELAWFLIKKASNSFIESWSIFSFYIKRENWPEICLKKYDL